MEIKELIEIADQVEKMLSDPNYVEIEGDNRIRIDWGRGSSVWLNTDGTYDGNVINRVGAFLKSKGFKAAF